MAVVFGMILTPVFFWLLFIDGIAGSSIISVHALVPTLERQSSSTEDQIPQYLAVHTPAESFALPIRLKIPKINVDALIEHVGLTSDGAMDVPKERANVGWFHLGLRPGENGSAVMAGHYGWKNKEASVFDNLYKLRKGDMVYVEDESGVTTTFVVRESRRYDPEADASGVFGSYDGKPHLNLITCEGAWDAVTESYSKRLVVFADKE